MKLNINSRELLALHNLLYERFESSSCPSNKCENDEKVERGSEVHLHEVYNRIKACIVGALGKAVDPFDAWSTHEQQKINKLNDELDDIKKSQVELTKKDVDIIVPDEDEDFTSPEYPRKGARNRQGNRNNKR